MKARIDESLKALAAELYIPRLTGLTRIERTLLGGFGAPCFKPLLIFYFIFILNYNNKKCIHTACFTNTFIIIIYNRANTCFHFFSFFNFENKKYCDRVYRICSLEFLHAGRAMCGS